MPLHLPATLSPSKVVSFRDCALSFRFSVIDRIVGDVTEPDFTALVVRKPPEAETTSDTNAEPRGK